MITRIFVSLFLVVIVFLLALPVIYYLFTPIYATSLDFDSLPVRIDRDLNGIPHIHAPSRRSFLYAWGYLLGEDRLFQITFRKLYAEGRLSQFLGQKTLQPDIMMRDLGLQELAQHIGDKLKVQNQTIYGDFSAFVQGINDQVAQRLFLPIQFYLLGIKWEQWTVATPFLLQKLLEWSISHNMIQEYSRSALLANHTIDEINKIIPNTKESWAFSSVTTIKDQDIPQALKFWQLPIDLPFQPLHIDRIIALGMPEYFISAEGSNAWAVSGRHTQSGRPLLSGDPHLDSALPSHWYQIRATYTQNNRIVRVAGVAAPGIPNAYGKNDYIASAMTVIQTDTQDLYQQTVVNNSYLLNQKWKPLRLRNETIMVKTTSGLQAHYHTVRMTHRGPILRYLVSQFGTFQPSQPLSLSWTGHNENYQSIVNCLYFIEVNSFSEAQQMLQYGTSHFLSLSMILATADDHLIYQQSGLNPIRRNPKAGSYVKNGSTTQDDWIGFVSPQMKMHVVDPKSGFIVTSNNRVASKMYHGGYFNHTFFTARADRLEELIKAQIASGRKITNQFAINLLSDTVDIYCRQILPQILSLLPPAVPHLGSFDCNFSSQSSPATMYQVFMFELWHLIKPFPTVNVSILHLHNTQQCLFNHIHHAYRGDSLSQQQMSLAWTNMQARLVQFFKTNDRKQWRWGLYHRDVTTQLPIGLSPKLGWLYRREADGWGNIHTPNVAKCNKIEMGNFVTSHRANMRSIFDFGGPSWWVIDGGVSENILSPYYDDQWKLLIRNQLLRLDPTDSSTKEADRQL